VEIRVQTRPPQGPWSYLGTEVTDPAGRIIFRVPDQRRLSLGLHSIRLTPLSDSTHFVQLTLAVLPIRTEIVVFSVDGSFAASLSLMGKKVFHGEEGEAEEKGVKAIIRENLGQKMNPYNELLEYINEVIGST
ncbi:unnamed protein product, partial [Protopolystoma xenopodis]